MLSSVAEEKLSVIAKRICQWKEDYFHDNLRIKTGRTNAERAGPAELKKFDDKLPAKLKEMQSKREQGILGAPDIMTTIKHMRELTDMVLPQHQVAAIAPPATVAAKQSSPKNKSVKKERCPNGTKRNAKTGKCEAK